MFYLQNREIKEGLYNIVFDNVNLSFFNCISGVMVSVLTSGAVDCGFEPHSGQTKDYKIGICCFSSKHAAVRRTSKQWLAKNQDNVAEWGDMSIRRLNQHYKNPTKHVGLVQSGHQHHFIEN